MPTGRSFGYRALPPFLGRASEEHGLHLPTVAQGHCQAPDPYIHSGVGKPPFDTVAPYPALSPFQSLPVAGKDLMSHSAIG